MKNLSIKKICAAAIIIIVFVILFAFVLPKPASEPPIPMFNFLSGRKLIAQIEQKTSAVYISETLFIYSFEADFNDIAADANAELSALGFINSSTPETDPPFIKYYLHGGKPVIFTSVGILKNHKMSKISAPENSEKMLTEYRHKSENGWVSVEIEQSVQHNRLIAEIKHFFKKLRGSE